jgi:ubiquinone/menaquinone biosynthesis C-methylase UbiE
MTAIAPAASGAYESLAPWYDAFTTGSDYEAWTTHVMTLAGTYGLSGKRLLDVACGTGKSFLPFLARGFEVTGCDSSPAMLAEAARKAPDVELVEADMRDLPDLGRFDLVTCFDDSLNHLLEENDLAAALASMARNLGEAGLLLFDLNTLLAYRTTFAVDAVSTRDGVTFAWRGGSSPAAPPGCLATASIEVFAVRPDGRYERSVSEHRQRHFPPHLVTALIGRAGLDCLGVHGVLDDGSHVSEVDESRHLKVMYAARLAKGGDPA